MGTAPAIMLEEPSSASSRFNQASNAIQLLKGLDNGSNVGRRSGPPTTGGGGTTLSTVQARSIHSAEPDCHGALNALPRASTRERADLAQCLLLRTTGFSRVHYQRSNAGLDAGAGLCLDTGYPQPRTDRRLATGDRRGARCRRPHLHAALACRTHLTSGTAAGSHAAGRPLGHYPGRRRVYRE